MIDRIVNGISMKLNSIFGDSVNIYSEHVKQGFEQPCFFILPLTSSQVLLPSKRRRKEYDFDIHYFPGGEMPREECLHIAEQLYGGIEYISTESGELRSRQMRAEQQEEVLHFFISYAVQTLQQAQNEAMGDVKIKTGLEG